MACTLITDSAVPPDEAMDFTYNPCHTPTFTRLCDCAPIWAASTC
ncbi:hypothetical protein [Azospirillum argentinense]|nr:hypothetical protein [Azospirillum argentinense]